MPDNGHCAHPLYIYIYIYNRYYYHYYYRYHYHPTNTTIITRMDGSAERLATDALAMAAAATATATITRGVDGLTAEDANPDSLANLKLAATKAFASASAPLVLDPTRASVAYGRRGIIKLVCYGHMCAPVCAGNDSLHPTTPTVVPFRSIPSPNQQVSELNAAHPLDTRQRAVLTLAQLFHQPEAVVQGLDHGTTHLPQSRALWRALETHLQPCRRGHSHQGHPRAGEQRPHPFAERCRNSRPIVR